MRLVLRHTQQILAAPGGANVISLVASPSHPPSSAPSSVRLGAFDRRSAHPGSCRACGGAGTELTVRPPANAIQTFFAGTIAKVASLVAIVISGYGFAHGDPGAKKAVAGLAAGTGVAVPAVNLLSWLWGV